MELRQDDVTGPRQREDGAVFLIEMEQFWSVKNPSPRREERISRSTFEVLTSGNIKIRSSGLLYPEHRGNRIF